MRLRVGAILVAVTALIATPTFAQTVSGGFKIGANFSKIDIEDDEEFDEEYDYKTGLVIGGFADFPITDLFSFQPEFLYSQKGGKLDLEEFGEEGEFEVKLDQIQIPLLFKANFAGAAVRPYVVFGPGLGFKINAETDDPIFGEEDISDDVETVEFSGIIGAGLQFGRGMVEFRYDHGFNDLDKDDLAEAKLRTFSVLFGIGF